MSTDKSTAFIYHSVPLFALLRIRSEGSQLPCCFYEFHGDKFHGNLKKFKPTDYPNPFSTKTALELFEDTVRREEKIKSLGYNLIVVWELDYDREVATTS